MDLKSISNILCANDINGFRCRIGINFEIGLCAHNYPYRLAHFHGGVVLTNGGIKATDRANTTLMVFYIYYIATHWAGSYGDGVNQIIAPSSIPITTIGRIYMDGVTICPVIAIHYAIAAGTLVSYVSNDEYAIVFRWVCWGYCDRVDRLGVGSKNGKPKQYECTEQLHGSVKVERIYILALEIAGLCPWKRNKCIKIVGLQFIRRRKILRLYNIELEIIFTLSN